MQSEAWITIEYEDGTVVESHLPDSSLLHSAEWIDWLIAKNTPELLAEFLAEHIDGSTDA
jgi:hypothetical protein